MVSLGNIGSLLLFVGPILLPRALAYYKSIRDPTSQIQPIRPASPSVTRALAILFAISLASLGSTFFGPQNIFKLTQSRLQIPVDVLFTRLASIRPNGLSDTELSLRMKLASLDSRLLYFQYGPDVIANCLFCNPEDPRSYLYYAIPAILTPHLFNLCILILATSGLFVGKEGAVWRRSATIGALILTFAEFWMVRGYNSQANALSTRQEEIDNFFWRVRVYRGIGIAALDGLLGWVIYLTATNRAFVIPLSPVERVEGAAKMLENIRSKVSATAVVQNTVGRSEVLRRRNEAYWVQESRVMGEVMENREVVAGVNNALESRINIDRITADAEEYAKNMMGGMQVLEGQGS